jgi:uncharacterized protein YlxW (UPF0749 family)
VNEHERAYRDTGTGWPGATVEPTDIGWPDREAVGGPPGDHPEEPVAVDAVPASVTLTPDEHGTDQPDEPLHPSGADQRETGEWRETDGGEAARPAAGSTDETIDLSRADQTVDLSRARAGLAGGTDPRPIGATDQRRPRGTDQPRPDGADQRTGGTGPRLPGGFGARLPGGMAARLPRLTSAGALIGVLIALLGFGLAVQLRSHTADPALASARQEDLVRILSDLEAREERTRQEISDLEERQRQLTSGAQGRQAALQEATQRADELGILAGTLPAQGPGLTVRFDAGQKSVQAVSVLDAIQELRGAGAEAMQIAGGNGPVIRVVASTYVVDSSGGIEVDGRRLTAPYTITVIGDGQTMRTALNIAGGVVESVQQAGGNVTVHDPGTVKITALHASTAPRYARPAN